MNSCALVLLGNLPTRRMCWRKNRRRRPEMLIFIVTTRKRVSVN